MGDSVEQCAGELLQTRALLDSAQLQLKGQQDQPLPRGRVSHGERRARRKWAARERVRLAQLGRQQPAADTAVPPTPRSGLAAAEVAVDNTDPAAKDTDDCGVAGSAPCLTIGQGVLRAAPGATVTVQGGGKAYRGECDGSGIATGESLAIVGVGVGGRTVIDCEGKGRFIHFCWQGGAGLPNPTLRLAGLDVRNGNASATKDSTSCTSMGVGRGGAVRMEYGGALVLEGCSFSDCHALDLTDSSCDSCGGAGGAVFMWSVHQLNVSGSSFMRTGATHVGGAIFFESFHDSVVDGLAAVSVDNCSFTNTTSGAVQLAFFGSVTGTAVRVQGTRFNGPSAGLHLIFGGEGAITENATVAIDDCEFANTRGAGVAIADTAGECAAGVEFLGPAIGTTTSVLRTRFVNTSTDANGSGLYVTYDGYAKNTITEISSCNFTHTHASGKGGGASVQHTATATGTVVSLRDTRFVNASATNGGGLYVQYSSTTHAAVTAITGTSFVNCSSDSDGGGAFLEYRGAQSEGASVLADGLRFEGGRAGRSGVGGGMAVQMTGAVTGASVTVRHSAFVHNAAGGVGGGGGLSIKLPQDQPKNLIFVGSNDPKLWRNQSSGSGAGHTGTPTVDDDDKNNLIFPYPLPQNLAMPCSGCGTFPNDCTSCPEFTTGDNRNPISPLREVFRRWGGSNNTFVISTSNFTGNNATYQGGAIAVPDGGSGTIKGTVLWGNDAARFFGGAIFIGGTVELQVTNSTLHLNSCGERGCQLFSSSGAGITFDGRSTVDLGCTTGSSTCNAGFSAAQAGNVTWSGGAAMTCPAGFQLVNSSALGYSVTLDSWKLEPPSFFPHGCDLGSSDRQPGRHRTPFHSNCSLLTNNTNCPCYFSQNPYGGINSKGFGTASITPPILVSTLSYACRACQSDKYNPTPPMLGGSSTAAEDRFIGTCEPCPYGSRCEGGTFVATRGFWGSSSDGVLSASRCPAGYCCAKDPCDSIDGCVGNRSGVLCGGCAPGFTQTIGSTTCRVTAECGGADAAWFVPGAVLLAALFALYARKSQPRARNGWPLNAVNPTVYFYQMAQLLPVATTEAHATLALLGGLFNMQLSMAGANGFACPFVALTTLQAIEMHFAVPAVVVALLALGYGVEVWQQRTASEKQAAGRRSSSSPWLDYQIATVKAAMLAFSTLLITTFQLLHCTNVGGARVVFRAATQACGAWQAPFYALAIALLLPMAAALTVAAGISAASKLPALPAALCAMVRAPYREDCWHWEAVLALHRLCVVAIYSLVSSANSAVAAVLQTLVCVAALMVHQTFQPFSEVSANRAQTALLSCLVVVALSNVPQAVLDTNAVAESAHAKAFVGQLKDGEALVLLAPALLVGIALLKLTWLRRRDLAVMASGSCVTLACLALCGGSKADVEAPLGEPLLLGGNSQLVHNSRGLPLAHRTPADCCTDEDEDEG
jgi:hypothetical protein